MTINLSSIYLGTEEDCVKRLEVLGNFEAAGASSLTFEEDVADVQTSRKKKDVLSEFS